MTREVQCGGNHSAEDRRIKCQPCADQGQGPARHTGGRKERRDSKRYMSAGVPAAWLAKERRAGIMRSRWVEAKVTSGFVPDFRVQGQCKKRLLKGPRQGVIAGKRVYCFFQNTTQQETKETIQVKAANDNVLDQ